MDIHKDMCALFSKHMYVVYSTRYKLMTGRHFLARMKGMEDNGIPSKGNSIGVHNITLFRSIIVGLTIFKGIFCDILIFRLNVGMSWNVVCLAEHCYGSE